MAMARKQLMHLKHLMREADDLARPVNYFLDRVAPVLRQKGRLRTHPYLGDVVQRIAERHFDQALPVSLAVYVHVKRYGFWHGTCQLGPHLAQVIYFEDIALGILSVLPNPYRGNTELFRFTEDERALA